MNEENEKKDKTLTIGASKLKLSKPIDNSFVQHSIQNKSNKVTVVKKKRILSRDNSARNPNDEVASDDHENNLAQLGSLTEQEKIARLEAIKKLSETSKIFESKDLTSYKTTETSSLESESEKVEDDSSVQPVTEFVEPILPEDISDVSSHSVKKEKYEKVEDLDEDDDFEAEKKKVKSDSRTVKVKQEKNRRVSGKINLQSLLDDDLVEKTRSLSSIRRAREKAKQDKKLQQKTEKVVKEIVLPELIGVQELANRISERVTDVIKELMKLGIIANSSQEIDADTAEILIETFGHKAKRVLDSDVEKHLNFNDDEAVLVRRAPIVTIMGHVDHGKTSLLDALRSTDVAAKEAGGITQHIGAYRIALDSGENITFIDTPGHEAFTAMRARGAQVTDIVILVVAADDGIMEQTKEAINHAKAAKVPIIVAVNKIDKPDADSQRVRNELLNYELVPEEFGGDIIVVDVSAKAKLNLDKLLEAILLQAEMLDLKANQATDASGVVIESKIDKAQGVLTTFLVQRGMLKVGDLVVAGKSYGKIRKILDDKGHVVTDALPSVPVEVLGLDIAPEAGDTFNVIQSEKKAREIVEYRERNAKRLKNLSVRKGSLDDLFARSGDQRKMKDLPLIIKGDVQGSIEAIIGSLTKFNNDEVTIKVLHTGVGGITKSDVILANASGAMIIGFNVRANNQAISEAASNGTDIRYYSIIYNLVDDIKAVLSGMLSPIIREVYVGKAQVQQVFNITKIGKIAGCIVTDGVIKSDSNVRLLRDNIVIFEGKLKNLKRYKDEVKEVKNGQECGISILNYEDIKDKDVIEVFEVIQEQKKL